MMETARPKEAEILRLICDSSPIGIYVVQAGRFRYVSKQFRILTGYAENELLDADPLALVLPEDVNGVRANAVRMLKGEKASPYEFRFVRKDGGISWILEKVASIRYQGGRAALGHFLDISQRKQREALLECTLEEARRERLLLLALSHASHSVQRVMNVDEIYETVLNEVAKIGY